MFVHRFNTFTHVLANEKLNIYCCNKVIRHTKSLWLFETFHKGVFNFQVKNSSNVSITNKHARNIAEGLQNAVENEITLHMKNITMPYSEGSKIKRDVVDSQNVPRMSNNLETLFHNKLSESAITGTQFEFNILFYLIL